MCVHVCTAESDAFTGALWQLYGPSFSGRHYERLR